MAAGFSPPHARAGGNPVPEAPRRWLVLKDGGPAGRVPFSPSPVLRRHAFPRDAAPPAEGDTVEFGPGARSAWEPRDAVPPEGLQGNRDGGALWAAATVECAADVVVTAVAPGAAFLFVNGTPYACDVYSRRDWRFPVALAAGANHLLAGGVRSGFSLTFEPADDLPTPSPGTLTRPDADDDGGPAGVLCWNPTRAWLRGERVVAAVPPATSAGTPGGATRSDPFDLAPLAPRRIGFALPRAAAAGAPPHGALLVDTESRASRGTPLHMAAAGSRESRARRRTFISRIDGSVQPWAELAPAGGGGAPSAGVGTLLSLHGAGVESRGQANAYDAKRDFRIACPTNRGEFGFDWQDWGRVDAYEVLAEALRLPGGDPARVYLSGHSMGGHGTWHLAANDPDRFLAAAPSAGWRSFDTYGAPRPAAAGQQPWRGADGASRTEELLPNLVQVPLFVLHGADDDVVPASEGEAMVAALDAAGAPPRRHFQPGAGHWWIDSAPGEERRGCVDWPGILDLFRSTGPRTAEPAVAGWIAADPAVDPDHHWLRIEQPLRYGEPSRLLAARLPFPPWIVLTATNVRRLAVRPPGGGVARSFLLDGGRLSPAPPPDPAEKSPERSGPLKRALLRRFVLVVGTGGTARENRELLDRARWDASTWTYRARGDAPIVADRDAAAGAVERGRDVVLYGNRDTNAAWERFLGGDGVFEARRGGVRVGGRWFEGEDLGALVVRPRADDPGGGLVAALADTGAAGTRLGCALRLFASGCGYPDWCVFSPRILDEGTDGVLAAGWFDHRWRVQE